MNGKNPSKPLFIPSPFGKDNTTEYEQLQVRSPNFFGYAEKSENKFDV